MPRKRLRSPHVEKLLADLAVAVYGQMLDRYHKRSSAVHDERLRDVTVKLLRQGMTPIELQIELVELRRSADELYGYFTKKSP